MQWALVRIADVLVSDQISDERSPGAAATSGRQDRGAPRGQGCGSDDHIRQGTSPDGVVVTFCSASGRRAGEYSCEPSPPAGDASAATVRGRRQPFGPRGR